MKPLFVKKAVNQPTTKTLFIWPRLSELIYGDYHHQCQMVSLRSVSKHPYIHRAINHWSMGTKCHGQTRFHAKGAATPMSLIDKVTGPENIMHSCLRNVDRPTTSLVMCFVLTWVGAVTRSVLFFFAAKWLKRWLDVPPYGVLVDPVADNAPKVL